MMWLVGGFYLLYGLVIGSFLNVCIYRIPLHISVAKGRSFCPDCRHTLNAWDLIPVLSWLGLGGKCRYCGEGISLRYPLVELLTGALFVGAYVRFGLTAVSVVYCLIFALLVVLAGIDWDIQEIPDRLQVLLACCSLLLVFLGDIRWQDAWLGFIIVSLPLWVVAMVTGGMGGGDVKMMAVLGLGLGPLPIVLTFFVGSIVCALWAIFLVATKRVARRSEVAFGPFLAIGAVVAVLWGERLIDWYLSLL